MRINARDADVGMPGRIAHLGQRPAARQGVTGERMSAAVDRQSVMASFGACQPFLAENLAGRQEPLAGVEPPPEASDRPSL